MDTLPTFSSFPQAGPEFLANLAAHNNREWFEAHKNEYHVLLLEPAQAFVMTLGTELQALSTGIRCEKMLLEQKIAVIFGAEKGMYDR